MSNVSTSKTFSFFWKVENFHLSNRKIDSYFFTPHFRVGLLQNTKWSMLLAPAGIGDPDYIGCTLQREGENEPEFVRVGWKVCVMAEGGIVRFKKYTRSIIERNKYVDIPHFIRKSDLLPTDMPENNLTIYCEMTGNTSYSSALDSQYDLETLSSDLAALLDSGYGSDFKMYCRGEIFNVHKYILLSRWPQFCQSFEMDEGMSNRDDMIMTGVDSSTLKAFLSFLYSGKLQRKDLSMELCTYMHEMYCDDFLTSLETPADNLEFVTHMHYESKYLTWEVGDDDAWKATNENFFRVIPLEEVYPSEMVIVFSFEKSDGEELLQMSVQFTGFSESKPILLDGEISFKNKNAVVCSRKFRRLVESAEEFKFPQFIKKSDLLPNNRNSKCIDIDMCICDGCIDTRLVSSNIDNASRVKEVKDLRKLMNDLLKSSCEKDLQLMIGGAPYYAHSLVVAARSERFRNLIQQNGRIIEIDEPLSKRGADSFIRYLYGGRLIDLDLVSLSLLTAVAVKYHLPTLVEKTTKMLQERQFPE